MLQPAKQVRTRGQNFDGSIKFSNEQTLSLEIVQFQQGRVYTYEVSNEQILKEFKRYLVVKKLSELFEQLTLNDKMFISEDKQLIIPIQVHYRGRLQPLNIQLPLKRVQFETEAQINFKYLKQIEKMSKQTALIDKYRQKLVKFRGDATNLSFKNFQISNEGRTIRFVGNNLHTIFNHFEPVSKVGIHYFEAKILKSYGKHFIFGVCSGDIKSLVNTYHSPYFVGLYFSERTILGNNKSDIAISPVQLIEGKSVIKVEIDMNKAVISWFLDEIFLCARKIPNEIYLKDVYPVISFYSLGDSVQLLW